MPRWIPILALLASGCTGSCWSSGGIVDECKAGWTRAECAEWDDLGVNGADWTFTPRSCPALGFEVQCPDGSYVYSASDC